jgi:hypothetical protein
MDVKYLDRARGAKLAKRLKFQLFLCGAKLDFALRRCIMSMIVNMHRCRYDSRCGRAASGYPHAKRHVAA